MSGRNRGGKGPKGAGGNRGKGGRRPPPTKRSPTPGRSPGKRGRGRSGAVGQRKADATGVGGAQVEGRQAVRELLVAGRRKVHEVVVSTDRKDAPVLDDIFDLAGQLHVPVRELGRAKLTALARTDSHQGVIATAAPLPEDDLDDLLGEEQPLPFLLAADGVTDPGNLGALLRTAECAGVTGVVLPRHRTVHVTPAVTKAAAGAVEHLRFCLVGGLPAALSPRHRTRCAGHRARHGGLGVGPRAAAGRPAGGDRRRLRGPGPGPPGQRAMRGGGLDPHARGHRVAERQRGRRTGAVRGRSPARMNTERAIPTAEGRGSWRHGAVACEVRRDRGVFLLSPH